MKDLPRFEGELRTDEEALAAATEDFGHIVRRRPGAVLRAASIDDVALALRFARERGVRVSARGQGHTTGGQSLREGGLIIDLGELRSIGPARREGEGEGGRVRCGAGARWVDVVRSTVEAGLTPPVLTDFLGLSVGGTLSVGGIGGQSFRYGLQVDQVQRLRVVTGDGEIRETSRTEEPGLFDFVRAGLGRLGVIVEAELSLVPAPASVRVRHLPYGDLPTFLRDQERLVDDGRFDYVLGNIPALGDAWGFSIEVIEHLSGEERAPARIDDLACDSAGVEATTMSYFAYANRLEAMEAGMRANGSWWSAHPWLDVFLPASAATSFIGEALAELRPADVGDGYVMTYPARRAASAAPLVRLPGEPHSFLFDVLSSAPQGDVPRWMERVERLGRAALERGGSLYAIGSMPMTPAVWEAQLGEHAATMRELSRRFDPAGVLTGGIEP